MPNLKSVRRRLNTFAGWTGTVAPKTILDNEGAPTNEFMSYADQHGLCLDWLFCNSERTLAMGYRLANAPTSPEATRRRVALLAKASGVPAPTVELEEGSVLVTDEILDFCKAAHGDFQWLMGGDLTRMIEAYRAEASQNERMLEALRQFTDDEKRALTLAMRVANEQGVGVDEGVQLFKQHLDEQQAA